jgi:hypothetical protein
MDLFWNWYYSAPIVQDGLFPFLGIGLIFFLFWFFYGREEGSRWNTGDKE